MTETPDCCPLCADKNTSHYFQDTIRDYWQCANCKLVFVDDSQHVNETDEKLRYDQHKNSINDEGYCAFLGHLLEPLSERLPDSAEGLDFGCGPGPTLNVMMAEAGWSMDIYDPFYYDNKIIFDRRYDFITATEVVEHIYQPGTCLDRLWAMLNSGGTLALMTKLVTDKQAFMGWHYKNDPTHVCFYSQQTFNFLADRWQAEVEFVANDVIFLRKASSSAQPI